MSSDIYSGVSLETLLTESLPGVALFVKHGDSYVLYKRPGLPFTDMDRKRLINSNISELYVYSSELASYNQYVESNLSSFLDDKKLTPKKKREILCQASVNYVHEIFNTPSIYIRQNLDRCKLLVQHILNDKFGAASLLETLGSLVKHSSYTYVHSVQVCTYSIMLHSHMLKCGEDELIDVGVGSLFHDYGKIYVPLELLDKPDKLTALEFYEIKKHCMYGYDMLKALDCFNPLALNIIKSHHEKMNGRGYPDGLTGDDIDRSAKIAAIADVYSALTTDRSYRNAMDSETALEIMRTEMEGSFDVHYLSVFSAMLAG